MKTATLTLKRNILVIELPKNIKSWEFLDGIFWIDDKQIFIKGFSPFHKFIGKPDHLKEEAVRDLVEKVINGQHFQNYNSKGILDRWCKTALESFNSALEREITEPFDFKRTLIFIENEKL